MFYKIGSCSYFFERMASFFVEEYLLKYRHPLFRIHENLRSIVVVFIVEDLL